MAETNWHKEVGQISAISGQNVTTTGISWATTEVGDYLWFATSDRIFLVSARISSNQVTLTGDLTGEVVGDGCARVEPDDAQGGILTGFNSTCILSSHNTPNAFNHTYHVMKGQCKFIKLWGYSEAFSYRSSPGFEYDDLIFTITAGPSSGTLYDENYSTLSSFPATGTRTLKYIPNTSFTGDDSIQFTIGDGTHTSSVATISLSVQSSYANDYPSVPSPGFGISQSRPIYDSGNANHYYIDADHASSTDTSNPNGSTSTPRKTIPLTLSGPSAVFVKKALWTDGVSFKNMTFSGSFDNPVWILGIDNSAELRREVAGVQDDLTLRLHGSYFIFDNVKFSDVFPASSYATSPQYFCYRHCELTDKSSITGTAISMSGTSTTDRASNGVLYDCWIHDNGYKPANRDEIDVHGVGGGAYASDMYVFDCVIHNNGGDCLQFNGNNLSYDDAPHEFYIVGNDGGRCLENFIDLKKSNNMHVFGNRFGGYRGVAFPTGSGSDGAAVVLHDGADNIWICKNTVYNSNAGIRANGAATVYLEGNSINRIYGALSSSAIYHGILVFNNTATSVVNNTVSDCTGGIEITNGVTMPITVVGNVVKNIDSSKNHIVLDVNVYPNIVNFDYNFYEGTARIKYGSTSRSLSYIQANTVWETNGSEGASLLSLSDTGIQRFGSTLSPLFDSNIEHAVYDTFLTNYGRSLAYDILGTLRPQFANWDIGAVELLDEDPYTDDPYLASSGSGSSSSSIASSSPLTSSRGITFISGTMKITAGRVYF